MPARVVVIGLDAAEATLIERWAQEGVLPTFRALGERSAIFRLGSRSEHLPDIVWPELGTGRSGASIGWYRVPRQLFSGEARPRPIRPGDADLTAFWEHAARAGARTGVLDVPWAAPSPGLGGLHVWGWSTHDKPFGTGSDPPDVLERIRRRRGDPPLLHDQASSSRCDQHDDDIASYRRLLSALLDNCELHARLARSLLGEDEWDLFVVPFSEAHCAGHQFWHFHDPSSPWHDDAAPDDLREAVRRVYVRLDEAVGELLAAAGEDATALVFTSLGMGPAVGGWQVLPEVLVRLGYGSGSAAAGRFRSRLPGPAKRALRAVPARGAVQRLQEAAGSLPHPLESPATRACALENTPAGAVRLNVRGRDPFGSIEPGAEYDEACEELVAAIGELENASTGRPAVASVVRTNALFEQPHANLPDLLVSFVADDGPIESVRSRRVGVVSRRFRTPALPRSGDHTTEARLWLSGPRFEAGNGRRADILDIAPTVLSLLGAPLPDELAGNPIPSVAPAAVGGD